MCLCLTNRNFMVVGSAVGDILTNIGGNEVLSESEVRPQRLGL